MGRKAPGIPRQQCWVLGLFCHTMQQGWGDVHGAMGVGELPEPPRRGAEHPAMGFGAAPQL